MEGLGGRGFSGVAKKPRSAAPKRLRQDLQTVVDGRDVSPPSSTPSSDNGSKQSLDKNAIHDTLIPKKDCNLKNSTPRPSPYSKPEGVPASKKIKRDDKKYGNIDDFYENGSSRGGRNGSDSKRSREGALAPANWKSTSKSKEVSERHSNSSGANVDKSGERCNSNQPVEDFNGSTENKQRKLKLKVGGVMRAVRAKPENGNDGGSSSKPPRSSDAPRHRQKLILQDDSDDDTLAEDANGLQGVSLKDSSDGSSAHRTNEISHGNMTVESSSKEQTHKSHVSQYSEAARKSKRVPKRRVLDGAFDVEDGDDEVQYLNKLKNSMADPDRNIEFENGGEGCIKKRKISSVSKNRKTGYGVDNDYGLSQKSKDNKKKPRSERDPDKTDYVEEEELDSDDRSDGDKKTQEDIDVLLDARKEPLTTRQRALQSGKGADVGGSSIEFPDGLPPAPPRRTKAKLSEVEQQAKKAEAAQRRRLLVKKQAEEQEAEAIKKILGQDSTRKKKEEKERKERDEKAQKKAAESLVVAASNIRWVMRPTGTVVTFGEDVGLPSIFCSKPCSYPPPRENCAGPSCTNAYKYRDSKLNLPLCSLRCYKAVQETKQSVSTC